MNGRWGTFGRFLRVQSVGCIKTPQKSPISLFWGKSLENSMRNILIALLMTLATQVGAETFEFKEAEMLIRKDKIRHGVISLKHTKLIEFATSSRAAGRLCGVSTECL